MACEVEWGGRGLWEVVKEQGVLLLPFQLLTKLDLAELYPGQEEVTGEEYQVTDSDDRGAFKANLDVGLVRTTTGARVFAAMKGAVDGGINVPHR